MLLLFLLGRVYVLFSGIYKFSAIWRLYNRECPDEPFGLVPLSPFQSSRLTPEA